jgi:DNA-binding NarL/FixJ family response regulator
MILLHDEGYSGVYVAKVNSIAPQERNIAELLSHGLSNRQIADQLGVTPGAVANHIVDLLDKLGLQSRAEIAAKIAAESPVMA